MTEVLGGLMHSAQTTIRERTREACLVTRKDDLGLLLVEEMIVQPLNTPPLSGAHTTE